MYKFVLDYIPLNSSLYEEYKKNDLEQIYILIYEVLKSVQMINIFTIL